MKNWFGSYIVGPTERFSGEHENAREKHCLIQCVAHHAPCLRAMTCTIYLHA